MVFGDASLLDETFVTPHDVALLEQKSVAKHHYEAEQPVAQWRKMPTNVLAISVSMCWWKKAKTK